MRRAYKTLYRSGLVLRGGEGEIAEQAKRPRGPDWPSSSPTRPRHHPVRPRSARTNNKTRTIRELHPAMATHRDCGFPTQSTDGQRDRERSAAHRHGRRRGLRRRAGRPPDRGVGTRLPGARFWGIGGPKMQAAGFEVWYPAETLAVGGYVEVLAPLARRSCACAGNCVRRLLADPPDLFVGVDAPDFNLGVEETSARARHPHGAVRRPPGVGLAQPPGPSAQARLRSRVLSLFPFEVPLLEQAGVPVKLCRPSAGRPGAGGARPAGAREQFRVSVAPHRGGAAPRQPPQRGGVHGRSCSSAPPS